MNSITFEWSAYEMLLINNMCETAFSMTAPQGLEWAVMVLEEWHQKHYAKIYNGKAPFVFKMKNYQALALREMLIRVGLTSALEDALRNGITAQVDQSLNLRMT
jgi:hypothetical protein